MMNEKIQEVISHPATVPVTVGVVAFGGGVLTGIFVERRRRRGVPYEVESVFKEDEVIAPPVKVVVTEEAYRQRPELTVVEDPEEEPEIDAPPDRDPISTQNVWQTRELAEEGDVWDLKEEVKHRTRDEPYVISRDEFFADEMDLAQSTVTYYAADDTPSREDDTPIYNHSTVLGELKFGHGSGDPNVVYIRNEFAREEFEVLFHTGYYTHEVLGLEIEDNARAKDLKHSSSPRRFRED